MESQRNAFACVLCCTGMRTCVPLLVCTHSCITIFSCSLFAYCLAVHSVLQPVPACTHAWRFAITVCMCVSVCASVWVCGFAGRPMVYMGHSLRSHNPTFEPIYSQGVSLFLFGQADGNKHNDLTTALGHWPADPAPLSQSHSDLVMYSHQWLS